MVKTILHKAFKKREQKKTQTLVCISMALGIDESWQKHGKKNVNRVAAPVAVALGRGVYIDNTIYR
jgi:hypothetical protein